MELNMISLFFVVLTITLNLVGAKPDLGDVGIDGSSYLFSTFASLYYKHGNTTNTLSKGKALRVLMDYNYAKGMAYFQESFVERKEKLEEIHRIMSVPLQSNLTAPTIVVNVTKKRQLKNFAVDWVHDRIIWSECDFDKKKLRCRTTTVMSADLQGGDVKTLRVFTHKNGSLANMDVDPFVGKIFLISDFGSIASCNLDGSDYKTILTSNKEYIKKLKLEYMLNVQIRLDLYTRRIFYTATDGSGILINSIDYDGGNAKEQFKVDQISRDFGKHIAHIDVLHETLFIFRVNADIIFTMELKLEKALLNGTIEARKDINYVNGNVSVPAISGRLVHPDLQPATQPKAPGDKN